MAVRIDEPRGEREAASVDDALGGLRGELADGDEVIAPDAHVTATGRCAAAVDDHGVTNENAGG